MNHPYFEEWILEEKVLQPDEQAALHTHLRECDECRALAEAMQALQADFRRVGLQAPQAGFALRWQDRLAADRRKTHQRQVTAFLAFSAAGAIALMVCLALAFWPVLSAPKVVLYAWLYQLLSLAFFVEALRGVFTGLAQAFTGRMPLVGWALLLGIVVQMAVVWLTSLRLATQTRSVSK